MPAAAMQQGRNSPDQWGSGVRWSLTGRLMTRLDRWRKQRRVQTATTVLLVVMGPVLVAATYFAFGPLRQGSLSANAPSLRVILLFDLVYVLLIAALIAVRVAGLIAARRAKSAGSRLHLRLTGVFAALALLPTIIVAIFSVLTINIGLESWFSDRVRNVLGASLSAAQAYEDEHRQELTRDARAVADYLDRERERILFMTAGQMRQTLARIQPQIERGLTEAFVIDEQGEIWARGARSYEFDFERPAQTDLDIARMTGLQLIEDYPNNEFRALIPLRASRDLFLYVSRAVDGEILSLLDETKETVALYEQLERERGRLLFEFGLLYLGFAVILNLAAVWLGLSFAERLSRPIGRLVAASQRVGAGDLNVRVPEAEGDDEFALLGKNFNTMTRDLKAQREALVQNAAAIDRRRRLFDSVLSSVTSGVVGLDSRGRVAFINPSAARQLGVLDQNEPPHIEIAVPEFGTLFKKIQASGESVQEQVNLIRGGKQECLLVRIAPRRTDEDVVEGYVMAFDDVTDLVTAQRVAAWGDVARRIAHEIKNPLTPIQLSAERIRRKFAHRLGEDSETLEQMTDVIVRQTNDLRRIVDEFSKFARMPEPQRSQNDLTAILRAALTLQEAGQPDVRFHAQIPQHPVLVDVDATMIGQALTNLIKNAGEAIDTLRERGEVTEHVPEIRLALTCVDRKARITIADNGVGLPEDRARLFEPYVTTRDKGTGLGLPIVRKIIEEHGGTLLLEDAPPFDATGRVGAMAVITLPVSAAVPGAGKAA